ncbi:MAG: sigma-70 family RNA polymerase sigma factor [Bacteroidota bacterium]
MSTKKLSPKEYIDGIRKGNPEIIKGIYEKYHPAIVHLVETKHGTKDDANDVFKEGLVLIYQKSQKPEFQLSNTFLTYFYAVCKNIWSNKLRKKTNQEITLDQKTLLIVKDDSPRDLDKNEKYFLYRRMFLQLGSDCQKVLEMFLRKSSMSEIMDEMGYGSISYTKKRKFLCKKKLVQLIQSHPSFKELTTP